LRLVLRAEADFYFIKLSRLEFLVVCGFHPHTDAHADTLGTSMASSSPIMTAKKGTSRSSIWTRPSKETIFNEFEFLTDRNW
jgi:hypothetical protein